MKTSFAIPSAPPRVSAPGGDLRVVSCSHCQLPVPPGLLIPGAREQFCCSGCSTVWQLLHAEGLESFYLICSQADSRPLQAGSVTEDYSEFDDPGFHASYVRDTQQDLKEVRLIVEGVHCAACVWLIEKLPLFCPGVLDARVQLLGRQVTLRWDPHQVQLSAIAKQLSLLGYAAHPATDAHRRDANRKEMRQHLLRLGVAGLCAGNAMLLAFALYGGIFDGISSEHSTILRWTSALLGIVSLSWPGWTFFRGAWQAMRTSTPHMDISLSLGLAAGGVMGLINTITGTGEIYFDSLCMLIFVLLIGRFLQFRQQQQAAESLSLLRNLTPRVAHRVRADGVIERVPTISLKPGDEVEVRVGDLIPADAVVLTGQSTLDQSLLTGESVGVPVQPGNVVTAGATNLSGVIHIRVAAIGKSSRIGRLMDLVESASLAQTPIIELANRISGYFLYVVITLAMVTLYLWWGSGPDLAINHVIALLIVACPCALGLATPMTIAIAQGRASRQKILIRRGDVFEILNRPGLLWLDKTGTITEGRLSLKAWQGSKNYFAHVLALEAGIVHPLAVALTTSLREKMEESAPNLHVEQQHYQPGLGVHGIVDHVKLHVGSRTFLSMHGIDLTTETQWPVTDWLTQGWTPIYIACDGRLVAVAALGDALRDDALKSIIELRKLGWTVGVLSGDHQFVVQRIASLLEIPDHLVHSQVSPEGKLQVIHESRKTGETVVMVGDGVNDAAALAAASVGIAVQGGAEVALQAAPVYLGNPGLAPLVELIQASRKTMKAIRNGLIVSLAYNLSAIGLAVFGWITPLVAAILMPISSLTVTILAISQRTFQRQP